MKVTVSSTKTPTKSAPTRSSKTSDIPITKRLGLLLEAAVKSRATDIHIEPRQDHVQVRLRIDGVLKGIAELPKKTLPAFLSRIKTLARLDLSIRHAPQEGRFKQIIDETAYTIHTSLLPIADGEKVVLHLVVADQKAPDLAELGLWGKALKIVNEASIQPHGLIIVTGPAGVGSTTTLYSILSSLADPSINISTIEDPIEYRLQNVNQSQVNQRTGVTYTKGLKVLLQQDPNIVLVGELGDKETAATTVQAALAGRLVLTTLPVASTTLALTQLRDMGVESFLIASTVRVVVAQRLVRRVCPACREVYEPSQSASNELRNLFGLTEPADMKQLATLEQQARRVGLGDDSKEVGMSSKYFKRLYRASKAGCVSCGHTGYKGRIGLFEVLPISPQLESLLTKDTSNSELKKQALADGMISLQLDGLVKALSGLTTLEEVIRVV